MTELTNSLVLAVDGSDQSLAAASAAGMLGSTLGAGVLVVHVAPNWIFEVPAWAQQYGRTDDALEARRRILQRAVEEVSARGCAEVSSQVLEGNAAERIVIAAERAAAGAIIMGRRGLSATSGLLLGSVSSKVGHLARCSVVTVGEGGEPGSISHILCAVDGSEHSARAAELSGDLAVLLGAGLTLLHVVDLQEVPAGLGDYERFEHVRLSVAELQQSIAAQVLDHAVALATKRGAEDPDPMVKFGKAGESIIAAADAIDADCIVMGRRGLGSAWGLFRGSVSHEVSHLARQTVITTR